MLLANVLFSLPAMMFMVMPFQNMHHAFCYVLKNNK